MPAWDSVHHRPAADADARGGAVAPLPGGSDAYRRRARRLRGMYAGEPARLQCGLRALARQYDRARASRDQIVPTGHPGDPLRPRVWRAPVEPRAEVARASAPEVANERFLAHVTTALEASPLLRYSQRLALLKAADGLGIGRFDANLIIAAAQHRTGDPRNEVGIPAQRRGCGWLWTASAVVGLQGAIVGAVWWLLHGVRI